MKWVRYGLWETTSKGRRECIDGYRIDVSKELGRYVATERNARSVATQQPSLARARSLRSDRAVCMCGSYVVIELGLSVFRSSPSNLSMAGSDTFLLPWNSLCLTQTGFENICRDILLTKHNLSRKTLILVFYGDLDINFVVTVFDLNTSLLQNRDFIVVCPLIWGV